MANYVEVRGVKIGEGIPKICVPIVGKTIEEIVSAAENIKEINPDVIEWRVDWFDEVDDFAMVTKAGQALRNVMPDTPILFTFRTAGEGGEKAISHQDYLTLNQDMIKTGIVDLVDAEAYLDEGVVRSIIETAHEYGVKVVASNHHFDRTPNKEDIIARLRYMQDINADIPKIAVMPKSRQDVLVLLSATQEMADNYADRPIITMSMAGTGLISRLCGEVFGSALTFGAVGKASAPGQMNAEDLRTILELLHKSM